MKPEKNTLPGVRRRLPGFTPQRVGVVKVGRNAPCPCKSGLKHKRCCGK